MMSNYSPREKKNRKTVCIFLTCYNCPVSWPGIMFSIEHCQICLKGTESDRARGALDSGLSLASPSTLDTLAHSQMHTKPLTHLASFHNNILRIPQCVLAHALFQMSRSCFRNVTPASRRSLLGGTDMSLPSTTSELNSPAPPANSDDLILVLIQGS